MDAVKGLCQQPAQSFGICFNSASDPAEAEGDKVPLTDVHIH